MKKEDRSIKMRSVYDTEDGRSFDDMREAQEHQAGLSIREALEGSDLPVEKVLTWIKSNTDVVAKYIYPHNVEIDRQN
jgi:hypothetical protein